MEYVFPPFLISAFCQELCVCVSVFPLVCLCGEKGQEATSGQVSTVERVTSVHRAHQSDSPTVDIQLPVIYAIYNLTQPFVWITKYLVGSMFSSGM